MNVDKKEHCQDSFEQKETFQQPTQLLWYRSRIGKREPKTELHWLPDWAPDIGMILPEEEGVEQPVPYIDQWIPDSFSSIVVIDIVVVVIVSLHLVRCP